MATAKLRFLLVSLAGRAAVGGCVSRLRRNLDTAARYDLRSGLRVTVDHTRSSGGRLGQRDRCLLHRVVYHGGARIGI